MLELKDVHTYYGNIHALKGVSLTVNKGEIVTLIGSTKRQLIGLNTTTLPNRAIGNATGVYNLMRNLGGSIGISASITYLARNAQANQALMVGTLTPYDVPFQQKLGAIQNGLTPFVGAPQAAQQAHGAIYGILLQQASLRAFTNCFAWVTLAILICVPRALLSRKVEPRNNPGAH